MQTHTQRTSSLSFGARLVRAWKPILLALAIALPLSTQAAKILYVQNQSLRDTVKLINLLKAQGHDLTVWNTTVDGNALTAAEYASQGYELLIVDEVIGSGSVGDRFNNSPIPVINWEGFLYSGTRSSFTPTTTVGGGYASGADALAANAQYGQINGTAINIVDASHPLAAGLPAGLVDVFDPVAGNGVITFAGGPDFVSGAEPVATLDGYPNGYCIFGVPAGVVNPDSTTNQARWVHLPWNSSDETRVMVEPSFFLFEAAVAWALDLPQPTKIRNFTPQSAGFLPTNTPVSFSVDKVTAGGSAVSTNDIHLAVDGVDVTASATITDGGSTWDVSYMDAFPENKKIAIVASASAADGGFSARMSQIDTFDPDNFTFEAEDFNFDGGMFIDNPELSYDAAYDYPPTHPNSYFNRVGSTNIDEHEVNFATTADVATTNEIYRYGDAFNFTRLEFVDTYASADSLLRQKYTDAGMPEYEVRNIAADEWLNYTRTYPTGLFNLYVRVRSAGALQAQVDLVDDATTTNQNLTKLGRFIAPSGTPGYTLVPMTDDAGNTPITLEFTSTSPTTLRVTAMSGGWTPNFYMLVPTEAPPNAPPAVQIDSPTNGTMVFEGTATPIEATVTDDGTVTNVQFFANSVLIGEDDTAPYSVDFVPPSLGSPFTRYTIEVVATDDGGLSGSASVTVDARDPSLTLLTTEVGTGADAGVSENDNGGGVIVSGGSNGSSMAIRWNDGTRNEIGVMRFDLSGYDVSQLADVSLTMVEERDGNGSQLALYGVPESSTPTTGSLTINDWAETNITFDTMPGLIFDADGTTRGVNTNQVMMVADHITPSGTKENRVTVSDAAIGTFIKNNLSSSNTVTFMLAISPEQSASNGQSRMASKEATELQNGTPTAPAGTWAPFLAFHIAAPTITIDTFSLVGDQLTLTWSGGSGPYTVQKKTAITDAWTDEATGINDTSTTVTISGDTGFYQVVGH